MRFLLLAPQVAPVVFPAVVGAEARKSRGTSTLALVRLSQLQSVREGVPPAASSTATVVAGEEEGAS